MIAIINVSESPKGINDYEVRINKQLICRFQHKREEGLAKCLQLAAQAVENEKWNSIMRLLSKKQ
jgi:hypothetical protein